MHWLNYHHLYYFWLVSREGGLTPAAKKIRLSHSTLSGQIHALEQTLGHELFVKVGRRLTLTEKGRLVFRYANDIFMLGNEMLDTLEGRANATMPRLNVGVVDALPKLIVKRLLEPALSMRPQTKIVCYEATYDRLIADLSLFSLDMVLADALPSPSAPARTFAFQLDECATSLYGTPRMASMYSKRFPESLDGAPFLLPVVNLALRRAIDQWFDAHHIKPQVVAEFEDSALLKTFAADGLGLFFAPSLIEPDIKRGYKLVSVGKLNDMTQRFYALTVERQIKHPAVQLICADSNARITPPRH